MSRIEHIRAKIAAGEVGSVSVYDVVWMSEQHDSLLAEVERLRGIIAESNEVCACGCPADQHENYGEDGEGCGIDSHECVRTCMVSPPGKLSGKGSPRSPASRARS